MQRRRHLILAMALTVPTSAFAAQTQAAAVPSEHRLTPAEVEQVLAEAAARREAADKAELNSGPKVSGEIGFGIGTGGYRSAYGAVDVPLDDGFASFSFSSERSNYNERWKDRFAPRRNR